MGNHSLLQGVFLTQGSNLGHLHCRQVPYHLSHQGSPKFWQHSTTCWNFCAEIKPEIPALGVQSLNHWTIKENTISALYPKHHVHRFNYVSSYLCSQVKTHTFHILCNYSVLWPLWTCLVCYVSYSILSHYHVPAVPNYYTFHSTNGHYSCASKFSLMPFPLL